jgi:uncharacterized protein (DUF433 family)
MKPYTNFIETDYKIMLGKPVIKGTRITVELILRKLAQGATIADLSLMYPDLDEQKISAVLEYAADTIANEESISTAV